MNQNTLPLAALLVGFTAFPLAATAAHDGSPASTGFSIGGGAGSNSLNGSDYTGNGNHVDDTQLSYKALVAYRFNPIVSIETQYIDFGTAEGGGNSVKAHGVTAGGVFEAPISHFVHPYGKAQALFWDADGSFNGTTRNETGVDFAYGAGARFIFSRNFDLRAEYERFEFEENDVHTISAMAQLNFGQ